MNDNETLEDRRRDAEGHVRNAIARFERWQALSPWEATKLAAARRCLLEIRGAAKPIKGVCLPSGVHKPAGPFHVLVALVLGLGLTVGPASARPPIPDAQVRQQIISQSVADYLATGHPCACPYNTARNGSSCGGRSAYSRPGGAAPLCYPKDVTTGMVTDWRSAHPN